MSVSILIPKQVISAKKYLFRVEGIEGGDLLMNKQPDMSVPKAAAKKQAKEDPVEKEQRTWREKLHYRDDIGVFMPGEWFSEMLKASASYWGATIPGDGKKQYGNVVKAAVIVEDVPLGNGKPLIPEDGTIIPYGRNCNGNPTRAGKGGSVVYKIRPMIRPWGGTGILHVFDARLTKDVLETLFTIGGNFNGLGDWRPVHGRFTLTQLEEINGAEYNK